VFTGIIETVGVIAQTRPRGGGIELSVEASLSGEPLQVGESVAVSGPCLTVERVIPGGFVVFASGETMRRTTVSRFRAGTRVNLERALVAGGRLGGHIVTGHVDATVRFLHARPHGESSELRFEAPEEVARFLATKGSIAIDGVSLTLNDVDSGVFSVTVIPHTLSATTLGNLGQGDLVNVEVDLIARYVHSFVSSSGNGITEELLGKMGW